MAQLPEEDVEKINEAGYAGERKGSVFVIHNAMSSATKLYVFNPFSNRTLPSENLRDKMTAQCHFIQPMFILYNGLDNAAKISNFVVDVPVYHHIVKH